jgi:hypothetical protein
MSEEIIKDGVETPNPEPETTEENPIAAESEQEIDYKVKFSESTREAQRLLEEKKAKDAEIERLRQELEAKRDIGTDDSDSPYPGFDMLSEEEQKNLVAYTNSIKKQTLSEVYKDPALAFAKESYNENKWEKAFSELTSKIPEARDIKEELKTKSFKKDVPVPDNITDILETVAKSQLFDKARDMGMQEALEQSKRIDIERQSGGDKTPAAKRSLEDWHKMAQDNPMEFAKLSKQFNEDLDSGKLK